MMKKIFTMIICLTIATGAFAQEKGFTWGVKAGLNLADMIGKDVDGTKMKAGFNAGIVTEFALSEKFSVGPELVYSLQGCKMGDAKYNASYINLPIMAKYYVIDKLSINLGPQFGYLAGLKTKVGSESVKVDKSMYNKFDVAIGIGATYNFGMIFADARYNWGMTNVLKGGKNKNSVIQIGVGCKF